VGQPQLQPAALHRAADQRLALQRLGHRCVGQHAELRAPQRLPEGDQLHELAFGRIEALQPGLDQLHQPVRRRKRADQPPQAVHLAQRPVPASALHQLAQVEHVAPATLGQPRHGTGIDLPAQHLGQQLSDHSDAQTLELEPLDDAVAPQRGDRSRCRLAGPHRQQHERPGRARQLVHDGCGQVVEQVRVVDQHHQPPPPAQVAQGVRGHPQQVLPVLGAAAIREPGFGRGGTTATAGRWQQGGQRAERHRLGDLGGHHQDRRHPRLRTGPEAIERQPGLARAGRAGDHHSPAAAVGHQIGQPPQLGDPPDEWPLHDDRASLDIRPRRAPPRAT
jgi:hypothetical protein